MSWFCRCGRSNRTAWSGCTNTPSPKDLKTAGKTLVNHYVEVIEKYIRDIKSVTRYLAVDGYFMKKEFILPLLQQGLHIITKARSDANLMYVFNGKQNSGRGRRKLYDGKINVQKIDKRTLPCCYRDEEVKVYAGNVYCMLLKPIVLAAFVYYGEKEKLEIIICSDTTLQAMTMCKLRFALPGGISNKGCQTAHRAGKLYGKRQGQTAYTF
jgi:hypothetical protein